MKNIKITIQYQRNYYIYKFSYERKMTLKNGNYIDINNNFSIANEIFDKLLTIKMLPANVLAVALETETGVMIFKFPNIPYLILIRVLETLLDV